MACIGMLPSTSSITFTSDSLSFMLKVNQLLHTSSATVSSSPVEEVVLGKLIVVQAISLGSFGIAIAWQVHQIPRIVNEEVVDTAGLACTY